MSGGMSIKPILSNKQEQREEQLQEMFTRTIPVPYWIVSAVSYILIIGLATFFGCIVVVLWFLLALSQNQEQLNRDVKTATEEVRRLEGAKSNAS